MLKTILLQRNHSQQQMQQADSMEEGADAVSPTMLEPNPQSVKISQQQKIQMCVRHTI